MSDPEWEEYARIQRRVAAGHTPDEHLDRFLRRYADQRTPFDLHDSRRWGLNLGRNLSRRQSARRELLRRKIGWMPDRRPETPPEAVGRAEVRAAVRQLAGDDWPLLSDTADGDYVAVAVVRGQPVGTLKSQVWRARRRLAVRLGPAGPGRS